VCTVRRWLSGWPKHVAVLYVQTIYSVSEKSDAASQVLLSVDVVDFDSKLLRTSLNKP